MINFRGILTGVAAVLLVAGVASADEIDYISNVVGPTATDFSYTLTLPDFNATALNGTLTGATLYFYAQENITSLGLVNTAAGSESFTFSTSSALTSPGDSANAADAFQNENILMFSQSMTLGGNATGACPESTPSSSCSSVLFTPPSLQYTNTSNLQFPIFFTYGTGDYSPTPVTGVKEALTLADATANYVGAGTFALTGTTLSSTTFSGGGGNVTPTVNTTANFIAEVDYTFTDNPPPSGAPEPATLALFSGALLAFGLYRKKAVR